MPRYRCQATAQQATVTTEVEADTAEQAQSMIDLGLCDWEYVDCAEMTSVCMEEVDEA